MRQPPAALLPVLFCAACASAGAVRPPVENLYLHEWTPPEGRACDFAGHSALAAAAAFDTVGLGTALREAGSGAVVFTVSLPDSSDVRSDGRHDGGGSGWITSPSFRLVDSTLPEPSVDRVRGLLTSRWIPGEGNSFLLRVDIDGGTRLRTAPNLVCAPAVANPGEIRELLSREGALGTRGGIVARLNVRADGTISEASVEESSGRGDVDILLLAIAEKVRFTPFLVNHIPESIVLSLPLTISKPRKPPH